MKIPVTFGQLICRQPINLVRARKFLGRWMTVGYGGTVIVKYKWNSYTGEPALDITAYHGSDTNPANEDWYGSATVKDPNRAEGYYMDGGLLRLDLSKDAREIIEHETTSEGVEFQIIWKRRR